MAIFISRPALKRMALRSGTGTGSRVLGFCAIRAARCFTSKTPKSRNSKRLPSASSSTMPSRKSCTMSRTSVRRIPVKSAIRSTSSFFVVVPTVTPFSVLGGGTAIHAIRHAPITHGQFRRTQCACQCGQFLPWRTCQDVENLRYVSGWFVDAQCSGEFPSPGPAHWKPWCVRSATP